MYSYQGQTKPRIMAAIPGPTVGKTTKKFRLIGSFSISPQVPRRKKPSQLDKNPNGSPIASSRNPTTTKPEPELMKKRAADSDDETDKHLPKVVGFHRWPKTPAVRRLRLPQSKFFRRMCDDCGYGTKTRIVLFEHFEKLHKIDDGVRCLECGRYFAKQEELDEHNELHYQEVVDKVSCITCRSIISYPSLKTHVRMIHKGRLGRTKAERESMGVKLLACPHCPYQVLHRDDFLLHLSAFHANDELPFPCDECGERFQKSQMLVKHRSDLHPKTAREYGPLYKCKECDLKFDDRRKMNHHRLTHRPNQGKQLCPDCGEFMGPAALRDHMTLAHGHPPTRECKECGEFFPTAMKVRQHQEAAHGRPLPNTNTMRRLKVCEDCGKSYKGRTAYNFHRARQHGDELEVGHYPCTTCGIVFPTMFQRRTHYQGAHGWANNYQMQFGLECKFCDVACPEKADFKEHMKDVHGMTIAMKKIPLYVKQREKGAQLRLYKKGDIPLNPPTVF
ncbi:unnamed protein product [Notodromas monacha]|uniref:C2H2-type domain-containing protein n=1 Tax=Notodromas monacha TaxID=399045 RepID=A0A7R9G8N5_9CRUS|nr:unnamed protein product [Notodromas monacha]CAG0913458.1 unnamed protein product [Notodromas monacha]